MRTAQPNLWFLPALAAFSLAACGGAAQPPAEPGGYAPQPEAAGEGEALDEADDTGGDAADEDGMPKPTSDPSGDFQTALTQLRSALSKTPAGGGASELSGDASSNCEAACQAFGSLKRAGEAICRMAGESAQRCTDARKTIADYEQRVASCGCSD